MDDDLRRDLEIIEARLGTEVEKDSRYLFWPCEREARNRVLTLRGLSVENPLERWPRVQKLG